MKYETMTLKGVKGVIAPWGSFDIGDWVEIDGEKYMVTQIESLHKFTDGKYQNSSGWYGLRGFAQTL